MLEFIGFFVFAGIVVAPPVAVYFFAKALLALLESTDD